MTESRRSGNGSFDLTGAVLGTAGLLALVYGVIRTDAAGWGSAEVLGLFGAAIVLLAAFVYVESRAADPLVPLRLFRVRGLSVSALALALNGGAFLGMFFMTALYLQQVHGDSALDAGAHFVPMGIAAILSAVVGAQLVTRAGTRAAYLGGSAIGVVGLLLLSRAGADADYVTDILPGPARVRARAAARRRREPDRRRRRGARTRTRAPPRASSPPPSRSAARSGWRSSRPRPPRA